MESDRDAMLEELNEIEEKITKHIGTFTDDSISCFKVNGYVRFYQRRKNENKYRYIPEKGNETSIGSYYQKIYELKMLVEIQKLKKKYLNGAKVYSDKKLADIYDHFKEYVKKYITPYVISDREYAEKWSEVKYSGNSYCPEDKIFRTDKGEMVRSKSELIIANRLFQNNIPYRYEYPLETSNGHVVYPDFTILNVRTRKAFIWEHYGLLDDPGYVDKFIQKNNMYVLQSIEKGYVYTFTVECRSHPLSIDVVDMVIKNLCK